MAEHPEILRLILDDADLMAGLKRAGKALVDFDQTFDRIAKRFRALGEALAAPAGQLATNLARVSRPAGTAAKNVAMLSSELRAFHTATSKVDDQALNIAVAFEQMAPMAMSLKRALRGLGPVASSAAKGISRLSLLTTGAFGSRAPSANIGGISPGALVALGQAAASAAPSMLAAAPGIRKFAGAADRLALADKNAASGGANLSLLLGSLTRNAPGLAAAGTALQTAATGVRAFANAVARLTAVSTGKGGSALNFSRISGEITGVATATGPASAKLDAFGATLQKVAGQATSLRTVLHQIRTDMGAIARGPLGPRGPGAGGGGRGAGGRFGAPPPSPFDRVPSDFLGGPQQTDRVTKNLISGFNALERPIARLRIGLLNIQTAFAFLGGTFIFRKLVDSASEFELALARVGTILGDSTISLREYRTELQRISTTTSKSVIDGTKALYTVISAGIKSNDSAAGALAVVREAAKLATVGLSEQAEAAEATTSILNAYSDAGLTAASVNDKLFETLVIGRTTIQKVSGQIGRVAKLGEQFNIPIDELLGAFAELTRVVPNTSEAITLLRSLLTGIAKPAKSVKDSLDAIGKSAGKENFGDLFSAASLETKGLAGVLDELDQVTGNSGTAMTKLFPNVRAMNGAMILGSKGTDLLRKATERLANSTGKVNARLAMVEDTYLERLGRARNRIRVVFDNIGEKILPSVATAFENFASYLERNSDKIAATIIEVSNIIMNVVSTIKDAFFDLQSSSIGSIAKTFIDAVGTVIASLERLLNITSALLQLLIAGKIISIVTGIAGAAARASTAFYGMAAAQTAVARATAAATAAGAAQSAGLLAGGLGGAAAAAGAASLAGAGRTSRFFGMLGMPTKAGLAERNIASSIASQQASAQARAAAAAAAPPPALVSLQRGTGAGVPAATAQGTAATQAAVAANAARSAGINAAAAAAGASAGAQASKAIQMGGLLRFAGLMALLLPVLSLVVDKFANWMSDLEVFNDGQSGKDFDARVAEAIEANKRVKERIDEQAKKAGFTDAEQRARSIEAARQGEVAILNRTAQQTIRVPTVNLNGVVQRVEVEGDLTPEERNGPALMGSGLDAPAPTMSVAPERYVTERATNPEFSTFGTFDDLVQVLASEVQAAVAGVDLLAVTGPLQEGGKQLVEAAEQYNQVTKTTVDAAAAALEEARRKYGAQAEAARKQIDDIIERGIIEYKTSNTRGTVVASDLAGDRTREVLRGQLTDNPRDMAELRVALGKALMADVRAARDTGIQQALDAAENARVLTERPTTKEAEAEIRTRFRDQERPELEARLREETAPDTAARRAQVEREADALSERFKELNSETYKLTKNYQSSTGAIEAANRAYEQAADGFAKSAQNLADAIEKFFADNARRLRKAKFEEEETGRRAKLSQLRVRETALDFEKQFVDARRRIEDMRIAVRQAQLANQKAAIDGILAAEDLVDIYGGAYKDADDARKREEAGIRRRLAAERQKAKLLEDERLIAVAIAELQEPREVEDADLVVRGLNLRAEQLRLNAEAQMSGSSENPEQAAELLDQSGQTAAAAARLKNEFNPKIAAEALNEANAKVAAASIQAATARIESAKAIQDLENQLALVPAAAAQAITDAIREQREALAAGASELGAAIEKAAMSRASLATDSAVRTFARGARIVGAAGENVAARFAAIQQAMLAANTAVQELNRTGVNQEAEFASQLAKAQAELDTRRRELANAPANRSAESQALLQARVAELEQRLVNIAAQRSVARGDRATQRAVIDATAANQIADANENATGLPALLGTLGDTLRAAFAFGSQDLADVMALAADDFGLAMQSALNSVGTAALKGLTSVTDSFISPLATAFVDPLAGFLGIFGQGVAAILGFRPDQRGPVPGVDFNGRFGDLSPAEQQRQRASMNTRENALFAQAAGVAPPRTPGEAGTQAMSQETARIQLVIQGVVETLPKMVQSFIDTFVRLFPSLVEGLSQVLLRSLKLITNNFGQIVTTATGAIIDSIIPALLEAVGYGIPVITAQVLAKMPEILGQVVGGSPGAAGGFLKGMWGGFTGIGSSIAGLFHDGGTVRSGMRNPVAAAAMANLGAAAFEVGGYVGPNAFRQSMASRVSKDDVVALLQVGERVVSNAELAKVGGAHALEQFIQAGGLQPQSAPAINVVAPGSTRIDQLGPQAAAMLVAAARAHGGGGSTRRNGWGRTTR